MAVVIDSSMRRESYLLDGFPTRYTVSVVSKWILIGLAVTGALTIGVLSLTIVAFVLLGQVQINALLRGSTDLLSYSPYPPPGYSYGGFILTGYRTWVEKTPLLVARSDHSVATCQEKFYIIGGQEGLANISSSITLYNPTFETLTVLAPLLSPRTRMPVACFNNNTIVIAGGYDSYYNVVNGFPLSSTHIYDITSNTWSESTPMLAPRSDSWGVTVNGLFYFVGGYEKLQTPSRRIESFDGVTWRALSPMPTARGDVGVAAMNGLIYAVGGLNMHGFQSACEAYNPVTDTWQVLAAMPTPHGDNAVIVHQGVLHSIGGEMWSGEYAPCSYDPSQSCPLNQIPSNDHFVYDQGNDFWVEGQPLANSRFRFGAADGPQSLWIFGGAGANMIDLALVESLYNTGASYQNPLYYHTLA